MQSGTPTEETKNNKSQMVSEERLNNVFYHPLISHALSVIPITTTNLTLKHHHLNQVPATWQVISLPLPPHCATLGYTFNTILKF